MVSANDSRMAGQHLQVQALKIIILKLDSTDRLITPIEISISLFTSIQEKTLNGAKIISLLKSTPCPGAYQHT